MKNYTLYPAGEKAILFCLYLFLLKWTDFYSPFKALHQMLLLWEVFLHLLQLELISFLLLSQHLVSLCLSYGTRWGGRNILRFELSRRGIGCFERRELPISGSNQKVVRSVRFSLEFLNGQTAWFLRVVSAVI